MSGRNTSESTEIFIEIAPALRPRNRHHVLALGEHPSQSKLCRGAGLLRSQLLDSLDERQISLEIVALETRRYTPKVVRSKRVVALDLTGEKPATERAIGDQTDAEFSADVENLLFRIAGP